MQLHDFRKTMAEGAIEIQAMHRAIAGIIKCAIDLTTTSPTRP